MLSVWDRGWSAGREAEWPLNGHVEEQRQLWYMTGEVDERSEACQEQSEACPEEGLRDVTE